jgi:ribonucleoside-diphosphate reductase alpha chain
METAYKFAKHWRALGIGQLGWHSLLQLKMIPFESFEALELTEEISKFIDERSLAASKEMAEIYGEPEGLIGYGIRNLTRCAIAPTTSSSFILGQVSPSIEPLASNYFVKDLAKGVFTYKNPYLVEVLEAHGKNDDETWDSILMRKGSVQHLDFLTQKERDVFKTFSEISPLNVVQQAAARQSYIDQSQSLNLMIPPDAPAKDVNALIIEGWRLGVKTFYYQRSSNPAQELVRDIMTCVSCEA